MPLPGVHACVIKDKSAFEPDSFRTEKRDHEGKPYQVLIGKLKDGTQAMAEHSYHYDAEKWPEQQAKAHCKDHEGSFEAAASDGAQGRCYPCVTDAVLSLPWAILPEKLRMILDVVRLRASGGRISAEDLTAFRDNRPQGGIQRAGRVAVLPLFGVIAHRMNMMDEMSGGTSTEQFGAAFDSLVDDSSVKAIVLLCDSPGGVVQGTPELASKIYAARDRKRVVAAVDPLAASAAYWIASAASEINITPSGQAGSIGVLAAHEDQSKMHEQLGVKTTVISAGKYKAEGNPFTALSEDGQARMQELVDQYYDQFVDAVAKHRGATSHAVRSGYGQGRVLTAREALAAGMVDKIATLEQVLKRLGGDLSAVPHGIGASADVLRMRQAQRKRETAGLGG